MVSSPEGSSTAVTSSFYFSLAEENIAAIFQKLWPLSALSFGPTAQPDSRTPSKTGPIIGRKENVGRRIGRINP